MVPSSIALVTSCSLMTDCMSFINSVRVMSQSISVRAASTNFSDSSVTWYELLAFSIASANAAASSDCSAVRSA